MSGFMTGRSTANLLTRTTAALALAFFATSILLVVLSSPTKVQRSIVDQGPGPNLPMAPAPSAPIAPVAPAPAIPAAPAEPSAPVR
jgi:preprotein translocase subunit SecG